MITNRVGLVESASPVGWWLARAMLFLASVVALVSFGGQAFLAPFLVPLQWVVARHSERSARILFTLLASLLVGEIGWMAGYVFLGEAAAILIGLVVVVATGVLFFRSSMPRSTTAR